MPLDYNGWNISYFIKLIHTLQSIKLIKSIGIIIVYQIRKPLSKVHQYLPTMWHHTTHAELENPHSLYTLSQAMWTQNSDPCVLPSKQNYTHPDIATYSIPLVLREDLKATLLLYIYHTVTSSL